jgi:hypothetical protein
MYPYVACRPERNVSGADDLLQKLGLAEVSGMTVAIEHLGLRFNCFSGTAIRFIIFPIDRAR